MEEIKYILIKKIKKIESLLNNSKFNILCFDLEYILRNSLYDELDKELYNELTIQLNQELYNEMYIF